MPNIIDLPSPIGGIKLTSDGHNITELNINVEGAIGNLVMPDSFPDKILESAAYELESFFNGKLDSFKTPINPEGSSFQKSVWAEMKNIPFGKTMTYGGLAKLLNTSPRAVGRACGENPILLMVPCHRVVGAKNIGGFGGKCQHVQTKSWLLNHEKEFFPEPSQTFGIY